MKEDIREIDQKSTGTCGQVVDRIMKEAMRGSSRTFRRSELCGASTQDSRCSSCDDAAL